LHKNFFSKRIILETLSLLFKKISALSSDSADSHQFLRTCSLLDI